jgi:hypothetical protein
VASGARAISVDYGPWTGLYFHHSGLSTASLTHLELSVNGGTVSGKALQVCATVGGAQRTKVALAPYCAGGVIPANAWTRCRVPVAALGVSNATIDGIQIREAAGRTLSRTYVDDVSFAEAAAPAPAVPAAPAGLAAVPSATAVDLSWSAVPSATGYHVYRSAAGGAAARLTSSPVLTPSYRDTAITAGTAYAFSVSAVNAAGEGPRSAGVSVTVPAPAPSEPGYVYRDAMVSPWTDSSWATHDVASTATVASGTRAISAQMAAWQAVYFTRSAFVPPADSSLTFFVNGGSGGAGAALRVRAVTTGNVWQSGADLGPRCEGGTIPANRWVRCTIPMSALAPAGAAVTGLAVQEWRGGSVPTIHFDDVAILASTTPPPTTPPPPPPPPAEDVSVSVSPPEAAVEPGGTVRFTATVTGSSNTTVNWSVAQGAAAGSISASGLYTAPAASGTYDVVATSDANPARTARAVVVVGSATPPPPPAGGAVDRSILAGDRATDWNPGLNAVGGIPSYTTVHSTLSASSGDRRSAIQSALDAAGAAAAADGVGRVVRLGAGTFSFSGSIYVPSRVVLRGAGLDASGRHQTILVHTPGNQSSVIFGQLWPWGAGVEGTARNLTADAVKGARSVTVASTSGLTVGSLVTIDEVTDGPASGFTVGANVRAIYRNDRHPLSGNSRGWWCRTNRPISQVLEVASVSGNTVTFTTPFHITFRTSQQAQLINWLKAPVQRAGVEDLRISGSGDSRNGLNGNGVYFAIAKESWAKNIEVDGSYGSAVQFATALRCVLRDSYLHDTAYFNPGGAGYAVDVTRGSADNLIENNIIVRFNKVSQFRASGGGNVFAYNYTDDGGIQSSPSWVETGIQASHYPTPHYELFEGNYSWNADGEFTEGNAIYVTFFRNHLSGKLANTPGWLSDGGPRRMASAFFGHRWYSFVGNVLGLPGTSYSSYATDSNSSAGNAIWRAGVFDNDQYYDARVRETMQRDGNFDYKSNSVSWWGVGGAGSAARAIPPSLYLTSKPGFFGSNPWPWVDPTGATKVFVLPARARFEANYR